MDLNFGHIEIFSKEPLVSKDFYINILGYELETIQHDKYVWLKKDNSVILIRPGKSVHNSDNYSNSKTGFVLYTDNLDEAADTFKKRGLVFKGTDGSDKCLTFTDYDGNWFQLVNPNEH
jgi:catechol 2,3-dioxygenase-like lactoylglutathione lyase family enzyme